jgi:hypothetical protein
MAAFTASALTHLAFVALALLSSWKDKGKCQNNPVLFWDILFDWTVQNVIDSYVPLKFKILLNEPQPYIECIRDR